MNRLLSLAVQPWAQNLGWTLIHFLWQGAALGLLAWLSLILLRGASARARYGLACAFLVLMVAAPAATFLLFQRQPPVGTPAETVTLNGEGPAPTPIPPPAPGPLAQQVKARLDPTLPWLLAGWAAGVLLLSARFLGSWFRVQRLRHRSAVPVPAEWHLVLSRLSRELKLSRTVRLLQSAAVEVPTALGWLYPIILLPACALSGLSPLQLEAILAHELAHIRRGDFLVNLLQSLVETLLFYHPAVWWLSARIRAERELCCDDVAAALCGDPLILARALTELEALRIPLDPSPTHLALAANGGSLMHRIRHLLHPALPITSGARAGALTLLAASLLGAAGVAFQDKDPSSTPKTEHTRMKVIDGDRKLDLRMKGEVRLDATAKEPVTVPGEGSFRIEEKKGGKARAYAATKDKRSYTVDGQEKPMDAEAEAWVREVVKEAAKAQAGKDKARRVIVHTRPGEGHASHDIDVHAKALEAHARDMEAHAKALDAQNLSPEERARLQADMDKARAEMAKAKAELRKEIRVLVREQREGEKDQAGRHVEIHTEDVGPGTVIIRKKVDGKDVIEKRVMLQRKDRDAKDGAAWTFMGPEGEDVIIEGMDKEIHIPPIHIPRARLRHLPPMGMGVNGDPQTEMAEIKAELRALQSRLEQLQKHMADAPKPPKSPRSPAPPKGVPPPPPLPPPPPPPPPPPAPEAPDAPPAPPEPPEPPAEPAK